MGGGGGDEGEVGRGGGGGGGKLLRGFWFFVESLRGHGFGCRQGGRGGLRV